MLTTHAMRCLQVSDMEAFAVSFSFSNIVTPSSLKLDKDIVYNKFGTPSEVVSALPARHLLLSKQCAVHCDLNHRHRYRCLIF